NEFGVGRVGAQEIRDITAAHTTIVVDEDQHLPSRFPYPSIACCGTPLLRFQKRANGKGTGASPFLYNSGGVVRRCVINDKDLGLYWGRMRQGFGDSVKAFDYRMGSVSRGNNDGEFHSRHGMSCVNAQRRVDRCGPSGGVSAGSQDLLSDLSL